MTVNVKIALPPALDFDTLRCANVARCEAVFHLLIDWSLTDWATAMGGECGEALNVVKKLRRFADDVASGHMRQSERPALVRQLAHELADTVIYADLLAARAGINLGEAVREKFNVVSDKRGCGIKL